MILLLSLIVILATIYEYPVSVSGLESCKKSCPSLSNEVIYSQASQPEFVRIARDGKHPVPEAPLWGNPCNYPNGTKPVRADEDHHILSEYVSDVVYYVMQASQDIESYKDMFAKALYDVEDFDTLLKPYENQKWLRSMPWAIAEVLPENKKIFNHTSKTYLNGLTHRLDRVLPKLHKACKMVLSGLRVMTYYGVCEDALKRDKQIRPNLDQSTRLVRQVLCKFTNYMNKRGTKSIWMYHLEEPNIIGNNTILIYRDAINYLQYLEDVFRAILKVTPNNQ